MGQTKIVTVFKYIMENTVEQVYGIPLEFSWLIINHQNILTLQKKKSQLSKFSLDGGTDNSAIGRLDVREAIVTHIASVDDNYRT